jgi:MSHA biogenesis protein MshK
MKRLLLLLCLGLTHVQADTLTDPTKPSPNTSMLNTGKDPKAAMTMALTLTAIINNNQTKQAIINGRSFAEGQQIQGYKVILISQNHVILDGSDGKQTLYVNNNNIKKDANNGF